MAISVKAGDRVLANYMFAMPGQEQKCLGQHTLQVLKVEQRPTALCKTWLLVRWVSKEGKLSKSPTYCPMTYVARVLKPTENINTVRE